MLNAKELYEQLWKKKEKTLPSRRKRFDFRHLDVVQNYRSEFTISFVWTQ